MVLKHVKKIMYTMYSTSDSDLIRRGTHVRYILKG